MNSHERFNRAETFRLLGEYQKAMDEYREILLHPDCPQFGRTELASKFNECKYALENQRLGWFGKLWRSLIGQKNLEENNG